MNISFAHIENVKHIKMISANATFGVGFLTAIAFWFCNLLGIVCDMYDQKIEKAKSLATYKLIAKANTAGATGIMDVKFQLHGTTIFMYGIAYSEE